MTKILLIEDNEDVRENTAEILELANYEVLTAEDGKKGVAIAKDILPDIIICDIMMPELDGYGVFHILSKDDTTSGIPFVFLTAKADKQDFRKGMSLGADDYLTKPFDEVELLNAIEIRLKKRNVLSNKRVDEHNDVLMDIKAFEDLLEKEEVITFINKENIFKESGYPNVLFYLKKGSVKVWKLDQNGKSFILKTLEAPSFLGYEAIINDDKYTHNVTAIKDTDIVKFPKEAFKSLLASSKSIAAHFSKMVVEDNHELESKLLSTAYSSVRAKVASVILKYYSSDAKISMSREELASTVGIATETFIRALGELKKDGVINMNDGRIIIQDLAKLKAIVEQY